jgi:hypothetical protein
VSNAGAVDQVLSAKGKVLPEFADPPGGGGSTTPLTNALVCDADGTATTPTGAYSGDKAFNGPAALQNAIDSLIGGGGIALAPGDYSGDDVPVEIAEKTIRFSSLGITAGLAGTVAAISGNIALDASDAQCLAQFDDVQLAAELTDGGTGADVALNGTLSSGNISITGSLAIRNGAIAAGVLQGNAVSALDSEVFGALTVLGALTASGSSFASAVTCTGAGESVVRACAFSAPTQFDTVKGFDSTFGVLAAGTSPHQVQLHNCLVTSQVSQDCDLDGQTEKRSLAAGCKFLGRMLALDVGQGGDAVSLTGDESTDFSAETRRVACPGVLVAPATLTLGVTGAKPGQCFYVDQWDTAFTIDVKFGVTSIGPGGAPIPVATAGHGIRYVFQELSGAVVYIGARSL